MVHKLALYPFIRNESFKAVVFPLLPSDNRSRNEHAVLIRLRHG
jgi:hypothetical protein